MRWSAALVAAALLLAQPAMAAPAAPPSQLTDTGETLDAASTRAAFLELGSGARAVALGGAYSAVADDATALDWNPAGLGQIGAINAVMMHQVMDAGISWSTLNTAMRVGPGVAGLGVSAYRFGEYEIRDELGALTGTANEMDLAVSAGWAMDNPDFLGGAGWWGISASVIREVAAGTGFTGTVGMLYPLRKDWTAALAIQRLGPGGSGTRMPSAVRAGGMFTAPWFPASAAVDATFGLGDQSLGVSVGLEVRPHALVALRAGYKYEGEDQGYGGLSGVAAGVGFRWRTLGVDYAFQPFGDLTTTHRIALVYGAEPARSVTPYAKESSATADPGSAMSSVQVPAPPPPGGAPSAESEYQSAVTKYAAKDYDGAWRNSYAAIQLDPNHWQAWQMVGNCQYAKGDSAAAIISYRRALTIHPDNPGLKAFLEGLEKK